VIAFRHVDPRYPFLWESAEQPPARWHGEGEGPVSYFADTPHGAWAEFLRHEGITDAQDLPGVRRALWAVDIPDEQIDGALRPILPARTATGGIDSHPACRAAARRLRRRNPAMTCMLAPSAALQPGGASGWRVDGGLSAGPRRDGTVVVLYGRQPELVGWSAVHLGQPDPRLLPHVRPL
jgi:hypothetical protein